MLEYKSKTTGATSENDKQFLFH